MGGGGVGWVGGWLEQLGIKLISTQVVVEVEVGVELGNKIYTDFLCLISDLVPTVTLSRGGYKLHYI